MKIIDAARDLDDLRTPPGNRLEALSGDRRGQHSIRIKEQWGFGTWTVMNKQSRKRRNPQTGAEMTIDTRKVVSFKASQVLTQSI